MGYAAQQFANGLPLAALYGLLAYGYALFFALSRRSDLSYGALFAFSGQIFLLFVEFGWNRIWLILPAALALGAVVALVYALAAAGVIARTVVRPLVLGAPDRLVAASLGVSLVLMELARMAAETRSLWLPPLMNEPVTLWRFAGFPVTLTRLQVLSVSMVLVLVPGLDLVLRRSSFGRWRQAVAQDRQAAALCGVDAARIILITYLLSGLVAALAGLMATMTYGTMDFAAGLAFGVKILLIAAIGGQGTPLRAALGGAGLAFAETLWSGYASILWRDVAVFSGLVLLLVLTRRETTVP